VKDLRLLITCNECNLNDFPCELLTLVLVKFIGTGLVPRDGIKFKMLCVLL